MSDLTLSVVLKAVDQLTKPGKKAFQKFAKNSKAVEKVQQGVDRLGRTRAFSKLEKSARRMNRALDDQAYRLKTIDRLQKKIEKNDQRSANLRGKVVGTAAASVAAAAPVIAAANVEDAEIRLRTVINSDDKDGAMAKARVASRQLAREGFVGLTQAFDIQYALNSAGLESDVSAAASRVVAKVAKITAGAPEQVGEVIAGTYNNLAEEMVGTTDEKLARIGELLTKTQFKFQIRNFDQLGQGLSYAAASAASAKIPIEQVATVIGVLNSSQVTGSRAGTAFAAVERNMSKAAEEFGFQIVRNTKGQMDFIGTLEELEGALSIYDDLDERNSAIQETFGEEGRAGIVPLLAKLKELRAAQEDVVEGSKGIVDANAKLFKEGGTGPWKRTVAAVVQLAESIGKSLLPTVNALLGPISTVIIAMADFAEANPTLTAAVFGTAAAVVALRTAMIAGRLAGIMFSSGLLSSSIGFLKYGSTLMGVARTAVPAVITAVRAMSIALATTPIGLAVTGLVVAAGLVVANWEKVSSFMSKIWEPIKPYWEKFAGWIGRLWDKISAPFNAVGSLLFGSDDQPGAVTRAANAARPVAAAAAGVVTAGAIATSPAQAQSAHAQSAPVTIQINVTAAPGQDTEEIARKVAEIVRRETGAAIHD